MSVPPYDSPFRFAGGTADIDPEWTDINTLKLWLTTCDTEHHPKCFDTISLHSGRPRWLIDVVRGSLVPAKDDDQYATLSYVWGQTETVKTTKDNLTDLLEEGFLFKYDHLLPKTIRHTIRLVKLLGINYLWVDCLCIVQDDAEMKHTQLQEMGAIYAQAYVTIVAANGWDANHGLRGIRNVTEPRYLSRHTEDNFYESLQPHSSFWYSRGWTFQEMIFARRKIMFHYQVAVWDCHCATWHEGTRTGRIPSITNDTGSKYQVNRWGRKSTFGLWPDVRQYDEMIREYNARKLTFPADGLHAIGGLMEVWNRSFHGGFICGLPQMFFDYALLWQPSNIVHRRTSSKSDNDSNVFPSWSWVGWEGEVECSNWVAQWDYLSLAVHEGTIAWKLKSTVDWFCGEDRQRIEVSSHRYRDCLTDKSLALPSGWSRKPAAAVNTCDKGIVAQNGNIELAEHDQFVHTSFPGINFNYPIPLPNGDQQKSAHTLRQLLFGRTSRGFFEEDTQEPIPRDSKYRIFIPLKDNHGEWAGFIQLHDRALVGFDGRLLDNSSKLELVSISTGTAMSSSDLIIKEPWRLGLEGKGGEDLLHDYYNVLFIEWNENIAYRKGLGRICKDIWEHQATEWIDLTLG